MKRIGRADDVVMYVHSEFGRRVPENTSLGTDHGTAQVNFVIGNAVKGGLYGKPPSLTNLVLGDNLESTTDFRQVYATLIQEWMGADAREGAGAAVHDPGHVPGVASGGHDGHSHRLVSGTGGLEGRPHADGRGRLELRPRRAPADARRVRRHARGDPEAGGRRPRARGPLARALREHPESEDAAVRRVGALGSDAERFPGKPARSDRSRGEERPLDGRRRQAGRQPSGAARLRPLLLLAAGDDARNAAARLLVGEPDAADHASRGAEDGPAVARPLRHPREQGPRLPQDDAADRPVRAGRDRQPPRPDHPGRAEPGDAVLPRRAVQRQGRAERELRPRGDGALHHGRRELLREGRARVRARVHRLVLRQPRRSRSTPPSTTTARRRSWAGPGTSTASTC